MNVLDPIFDLAKLTRENRMENSLEFIIEQATKTSQSYVESKLVDMNQSLNRFKESMLTVNDLLQQK